MRQFHGPFGYPARRPRASKRAARIALILPIVLLAALAAGHVATTTIANLAHFNVTFGGME